MYTRLEKKPGIHTPDTAKHTQTIEAYVVEDILGFKKYAYLSSFKGHFSMNRAIIPISKLEMPQTKISIPYFSRALYKAFTGPTIFFNSRFGFGKNIFESDWDLLIILDTCRPDSLRVVSGEYDFINNVSYCWSVGGDSWEWIANTFDRRHINKIRNTAYITSNPNSKTVIKNQLRKNHEDKEIKRPKVKKLKKYGDFDLVEMDDFGKYVSLYNRGIDQGHGMYPSPRSITDHGIVTDRQNDFKRIILHYMPPHRPYIATSCDDKELLDRNNNMEHIIVKNEPRENTYEAYLDNLRWGLDEVSLALKNMQREKVVITADHGKSFNKYLPSHICGSINPKVRKVPWVLTTATDTDTYEPDIEMTETPYSADEILEALGYKV